MFCAKQHLKQLFNFADFCYNPPKTISYIHLTMAQPLSYHGPPMSYNCTRIILWSFYNNLIIINYYPTIILLGHKLTTWPLCLFILTLNLDGHQPTDRRTLSGIELISQLKQKVHISISLGNRWDFLFHIIRLIWILKVARPLTHDCSRSSIFLEGKVLTYSSQLPYPDNNHHSQILLNFSDLAGSGVSNTLWPRVFLREHIVRKTRVHTHL